MKHLAFVAFWLLSVSAFPQAPIPEALMNARTAFLVNDGAKAKDFDAFFNELRRWGRLELVSGKEKADIVIVLSKNSDSVWSSPRHSIRITKTSDNTQLWSDQTGDHFSSPSHLVSNLRKRVEGKQP